MSSYRPHSVRTASHPRSQKLLPATISRVHTPAPHLRQITLTLPTPCIFKPGQWVDLHLPSLPQPGGFTIITPPTDEGTEFELSVREAAGNPAAAWLWRAEEEVSGREVHVRVGGSFVFPPPGVQRTEVEKVVFVAGGVGVNPFLSMMAWIRREKERGGDWGGVDVRLLWSTKRGEWSYLDRVERDCGKEGARLFETGRGPDGMESLEGWEVQRRRLDVEDLKRATERRHSKVLAYVCGPKGFEDSCIDALVNEVGIDTERVFSERWW
ncbi:hypothetical protein FN846DRAFT_787678 [Sphaerosporella brunnea]|uniref:Oxidoreductase NAD-binding domain-containing protein 1 n=1 Tax=Sphaerosporella brunnea TaxID=1250544 RepID=A0A5J5EE75_9PEZI|nr:hypothetical protein FN846DRAFT_787678 [Sphaerosporella brunnea]